MALSASSDSRANSYTGKSYLERVWAECLELLVQDIGSRALETWFGSVALYQWDAVSLSASVSVPNKFVQEWLAKNYMVPTKKSLARVLNVKDLSLYFTVAYDKIASTGSSVSESLIQPALLDQVQPVYKAEAILMKDAKRVRRLAAGKISSSTLLNAMYTFESFIVGPSNNLAYAASKSVAECTHMLYNPLFIYGSSGLGKTHLLNAIGNYVLQQHGHLKVLYQPVDKFIQNFIHSIRSNTVEQFEQSFKDVDLLLLDDIQVISKKEQTQEAFFKIFNTLYHMRHQIVVTSDRMPRDIKGLTDKIRSRFEGGLIVDINLPQVDTMLTIINKKAEAYGMHIPPDVAHYIVSHISTSVRELEGVLIRLSAYMALTQKPLSLTTVSHILSPQETRQQEIIDFHEIVSLIATRYRVSLTTLRSDGRSQYIIRARHIAMYLMKKLTHKSFKDVGVYLHRDHTTVMHAYEKIINMRSKDLELDKEIKEIERSLGSM